MCEVSIIYMYIKADEPRQSDKRECLVIIRDNFCLFCIKPYVVTSHLNRLSKMVQMRGYNIWLDE